MKILAIDDEEIMLEKLCRCIQEAAPNEELISFRHSSDVLKYVSENKIDVAFLDIKMRGIDGLELGKRIKLVQPLVNIIFCTGYDDFIFEAVSKVRCNGYLLKPVTTEDVITELNNLRIPMKDKIVKKFGIYLQCFGNFQVFFDGKLLEFGTAKTKEMLAYLVDRKGAVVTNNEMMIALWEDDKDHTAYLKKCKKDLMDTLKKVGYEDIIVKSWGGLAIDSEKVDCDYYEWWCGKADSIRAFSGEYMEQYSWSEKTKASLLKGI